MPVLRRAINVLHAPAAERVRAGLAGAPEQLVLEPPAIDLMGERVEVARRAELDALGDVGVVAGGHEEPEPELALLVLLEVVAHADHLAVVVGADLDARLADLERRLGRRLGPLVGDQHAGLGALALELNRDRQPSESAAEDRHVVVAVRCIDRHQLEHRRRTVVCHQLLLARSGSPRASPRAPTNAVGVSKPRLQPPRRSTSSAHHDGTPIGLQLAHTAVHGPFMGLAPLGIRGAVPPGIHARRAHRAPRTAGSRRRTPRSPTRR